MAPRLVVTGASGYIGARLTERALRRGCDVVVLGSAPSFTKVTAIRWRLGQPAPNDSLAGADAILHLGHSWGSDTSKGTSFDNLNLRGTLMLARAALEAGVPRFVFASTTSARQQALNAYGRVKHAIEEQLRTLPINGTRVLCTRIGLVYGGPDRGQYGLISRLVELTPVLPMIGLDRELQPIHLDEVCEGLLKLALDPPAQGRTFVLAGPRITFRRWLQILKRGRVGRGLVVIPVPMALALLACDATTLIPFGPTVSRERVLGLAGAVPMDSAGDLAALGLQLRDPQSALTQTRVARRRSIAEAAAMLAYVTGRQARSPGAIIRLARKLAQDSASRVALPRVALRWPGLLRLFEPMRPSMRHGLCRRLHLAAMVAESADTDLRKSGFGAVAAQLILEISVAPLRVLLARVYA